MKRRRQEWEVGSIFLIQQADNLWTVSQVLDMMMVNCPSCAFYDIRISQPEPISKKMLSRGKVISAMTTTRDLLDAGFWKVVGHARPMLSRRYWPNESLRKVRWIKSITHGSGIVQDFLNAYYGLLAWDHYLDPHYFDKLLMSPELKPKNLIYKGDGETEERQQAHESI